MRTMKTVLMTVIALLVMIANVSAQASEQLKNSTPEQRAQKITDWMKTNLQLTDEQAMSVHAINLKYANENESLKEDTSDRRAKYKKLKNTQEAKDQELKGALTAEQFNTYLSKKKELQQKMREEVKERKN
jgi:periplasmic protein CpxP/Spy